MASLVVYQIPNGVKIARNQLEKLSQFERRAKVVAQQGADASKKADETGGLVEDRGGREDRLSHG